MTMKMSEKLFRCWTGRTWTFWSVWRACLESWRYGEDYILSVMWWKMGLAPVYSTPGPAILNLGRKSRNKWWCERRGFSGIVPGPGCLDEVNNRFPPHHRGILRREEGYMTLLFAFPRLPIKFLQCMVDDQHKPCNLVPSYRHVALFQLQTWTFGIVEADTSWEWAQFNGLIFPFAHTFAHMPPTPLPPLRHHGQNIYMLTTCI